MQLWNFYEKINEVIRQKMNDFLLSVEDLQERAEHLLRRAILKGRKRSFGGHSMKEKGKGQTKQEATKSSEQK